MTSTTRIAVVGSAYNPPTLGHADVIEQALGQADAVWLVPAYHHAWGKAMAPYDQRCAMAEALLADLAEPRVRLMAVEHLLGDGHPAPFGAAVEEIIVEKVEDLLKKTRN